MCTVSFSEVNLGGPLPEGEWTFQRYEVQVGTIVEPDAALLTVTSSDQLFEVRSRFRALVREAPRTGGDALSGDTVLAVLGADGENIPSGFRYCTLHEVQAE